MSPLDGVYLGVAVGTGSVRAGLFDARGRMLGAGSATIELFHPAPDFVEQSSDDIWRAAGLAVRAALAAGSVSAERVRGVGFDATCSLVALGPGDAPTTVSPSGSAAQNVIVWMDHRAVEQAARINAGKHGVLRYVGGTISPEMETPKLLWLKERMPGAYAAAARFFDLPDFLSYRATGVDTRSLCTTTCKWTYLGHEALAGRPGWDESYFRAIGLGTLADEGFARIGEVVKPLGERAGVLTEKAASRARARRGDAGVDRDHRRACRRPRRPRRARRRRRADGGVDRRAARAGRRDVDLSHGRVARSALRARRVGPLFRGDAPGPVAHRGRAERDGRAHRSRHRHAPRRAPSSAIARAARARPHTRC